MDKIVIEQMCHLNSELDDMNHTLSKSLSKVNESLDSVVEKLNLMTLEIRLIGVPIEHKNDVRNYLISYENSLECAMHKHKDTTEKGRAFFAEIQESWDRRCNSILEKNPNIAKYI